MELRFAHLADYVAVDSSGKLTIVGVFDIIWQSLDKRPIPFPPFHLVAAFEASIAEGADHQIEVRIVDDDENPVAGELRGAIQFRSRGVGHPAVGHLRVEFAPGVVAVPDFGDYYFRFRIGGVDVGSLRVSALAPPKRP